MGEKKSILKGRMSEILHKSLGVRFLSYLDRSAIFPVDFWRARVLRPIRTGAYVSRMMMKFPTVMAPDWGIRQLWSK